MKTEPSTTYKWGAAFPFLAMPTSTTQFHWRIVYWFKTRHEAVAYCRTASIKPCAIARYWL